MMPDPSMPFRIQTDPLPSFGLTAEHIRSCNNDPGDGSAAHAPTIESPMLEATNDNPQRLNRAPQRARFLQHP